VPLTRSLSALAEYLVFFTVNAQLLFRYSVRLLLSHNFSTANIGVIILSARATLQQPLLVWLFVCIYDCDVESRSRCRHGPTSRHHWDHRRRKGFR